MLIKVIEIYHPNEIEAIFKPADLMTMLLDEIKLRRPTASVKGTIWHLVGLLHDKFQAVDHFRVESQDVMFIQLTEQFRSEKPEIRAIMGLLRGLSHSLAGESTLDEEQLDSLFVVVKTAITPIAERNSYGVLKSAMRLLAAQITLFKKHVTKHAVELVTMTLKLCVHENMDIRDSANELLGKLMQTISDCLTIDNSIHKDIFKIIVERF